MRQPARLCGPSAHSSVILRTSTAAVDKAQPADTFMTAPSPGILTRFVINLHYPDEAAYLEALAEVMRD